MTQEVSMKKYWEQFVEYFYEHQVPIYAGGTVIFIIVVILVLQ
jgi:hypothetical protein